MAAAIITGAAPSSTVSDRQMSNARFCTFFVPLYCGFST